MIVKFFSYFGFSKIRFLLRTNFLTVI